MSNRIFITITLLGWLVCYPHAIAGQVDQKNEEASHVKSKLAEIQSEPEAGMLAGALLSLTALNGSYPELLPAVKPLLEHADPDVRILSSRVFLEQGGEAKLVRPLLQDSEPEVRWEVVDNLLINGVEPIEFLGMLNDSSYVVRLTVAPNLIGRGIDHRRVKFLLKDSNPQVRLRVARSLLDEKADWRTFLPMLKDESSNVRSGVASAMMDNGADSDSISHLLTDPEPKVRTTVALSLLRHRAAPIVSCVRVLAATDTSDSREVYASLGPKSREHLAPVFVEWMNSGDQRSCSDGAYALRCLEPIPDSAIDPIRKLTRHPLVRVRIEALELLVTVGNRGRVAAADIQACLDTEDGDLKEAALDTITALKLRELLPAVRAQYNDESVEHRLKAAACVAMLDKDDTACLDIIADAYDADCPELSRPLCRALYFARARATQKTELLWNIVNPAESWRNDEHTGRCYSVFGAIGAPGAQVLGDWLRTKDLTLENKRRIIRLAAQVNTAVPGICPVILELLDPEKADNDFHDAAFSVLGRTDRSRLIPFLTSDDKHFRRLAFAHLVDVDQKHHAAITKTLLRVFGDEESPDRWRAAYDLVELGTADDHLVAGLSKLLDRFDELDPSVEQYQVVSLVEELGMRAKRLGPSLLRAIDGGADFDEWVALKAVGIDPVPHIVRQLSHKSPDVRAAAAEALSYLGPADSVGVLTQLLDDSSTYSDGLSQPTVRDAALTAIAKLGADESLVPKLIEILKEDPTAWSAVDALGGLGLRARKAFPVLMRINVSYVNVNVARAVALIEPTKAIGLSRIRRLLREVRSGESWEVAYNDRRIFAAIKDLNERARPLIPELAKMVEEQELLHVNTRLLAAYVLTHIDSKNPKWKEFIEQLSDTNSHAQSLLQRLSREVKTAPEILP